MSRNKQEQEFVCGKCSYCNRELTSKNGYWVVGIERHPITKELLHFCHGSKEHDCFIKYGRLCDKLRDKATTYWKKYTPYNTELARQLGSLKDSFVKK